MEILNVQVSKNDNGVIHAKSCRDGYISDIMKGLGMISAQIINDISNESTNGLDRKTLLDLLINEINAETKKIDNK